MTVVETVYHQTEEGEPATHSSPYSRTLQTDEQAYRRLMKFGRERVPLDWGWVGERGCGMLVLHNTGRNTVYALCSDVLVLKLLPGETCRFQPYQTAGWAVSGESPVDAGGACRLDVFAIPL